MTQVGMIPRSAPSNRPARTPKEKWGVIEWFIISFTFIPALYFIPGASNIRFIIRSLSFLFPLFVFALVKMKGKGARIRYPAKSALVVVCVWLGFELLNPGGFQSIPAAVVEALLWISVLSPMFWFDERHATASRVPKIMAILLACNAAGAFMGVLQARYPGRFDPPYIPALNNKLGMLAMSYAADDGTLILRPCGLTDTPGGASGAGAVAAIMGVCWALMPIAAWKRLLALGVSFVGVAAIYFTQVRSMLVMVVVCLGAMAGMLVLQRQTRKAVVLAAATVGILVAAFTFAVSIAGASVAARFLTLVKENQAELYQNSRGMFVQQTFASMIFEFPIGAGMGRFGQIFSYFGAGTIVWCEVQWPAFVIDGGVPLLLLYPIAIYFAMADTFRVARTCPNRTVAYWAAAGFSLNLSVIALCFAQMPFLTTSGMQFWTITALFHAADRVVRRSPEGPLQAPFARTPARDANGLAYP